MREWLPVIALAAGCAAPVDPPPAVVPTTNDVYLIRTIDIGRITDGVSDGFDLDHMSTAEGDATGCGQQDWTDPTGRPGIDNAMGSIMPLLDLTEASVAGQLLQGAVNSGELLLLMEVSHGPDGTGFRMLRGASEAEVGSDGEVLPYQTFDLDPDVATGDAVKIAADDDGQMVATDFAFQLPLQILRADLQFAFKETAMRLGPDVDGVRTGVVAGGAPWAPIVEELNSTPIDDSVKQILSTVVSQKADLDPDDQGACQSISAVFTFQAIPAFLYDPP